jgi:hypothetical protein
MWRERACELLQHEEKIDEKVVQSMRYDYGYFERICIKEYLESFLQFCAS